VSFFRRSTLLAALVVLFGVRAHAADPEPFFNIGPGPLQPALERLAAQTGLQLLYDPALLEGRVTRGVAGAAPPRKALARLLEGTDVAFNFTADDAVALYPKSKPKPIYTVSDADHPRTITISTDRSLADLYSAKMNMTATKVDESFLNVPLASESLTHGVLQDLQANRLEDALQYVSGTEVAPNGQAALGFAFRGFPTYQYYLDGVRVSPDLHHDSFRDFANVERIDVVKGPASLLYGRTEPGGAVNVITKQPLAEPATTLEQQVGNFGYTRTEIDSGGPMPGHPQLLYRFNAAYERAQSFRDTSGNRRIFLAPVVTWTSAEATSTTFYAEYLNSHDVHDSGLPVFGSLVPQVPIDRSLEAGGDIRTTDYRIGVKGSHVFRDGWTVRHHVDARWINSPQAPQAALSDDGLDAAACTTESCPVNRELVAIPESRGHTFFISVDALHDYPFWLIQNAVLVGTDVFASNATTRFRFRNDPSLQTDLFHPTAAPVDWSLLQSPDGGSLNFTEEEWVGAYFEDQIRIGDDLHVLLGGRFDHVHERIDRDSQSQSDKVQAIKGRAGVLWHVLPTLSLYANFLQNFGVTAGLFEGSGNTTLFLPAEVSDEWETGLKWEAPNGRMSATLAGFSLNKRNISTPILSPALSDVETQLVLPAAHNYGLEADFRGAIGPAVQVLASYAYIHSSVDGYDTGLFSNPRPKNYELVGNESLYGVPENGGSLWATYHRRGLKLGLGAVARDARYGDNANDYTLPAFVKVGALGAYGWRAWNTNFEVQLNVDNLFDKHYFESLNGTRTVLPGMPRRFIATVRASF
jgi:iron complex outermembrane recepter protein